MTSLSSVRILVASGAGYFCSALWGFVAVGVMFCGIPLFLLRISTYFFSFLKCFFLLFLYFCRCIGFTFFVFFYLSMCLGCWRAFVVPVVSGTMAWRCIVYILSFSSVDYTTHKAASMLSWSCDRRDCASTMMHQHGRWARRLSTGRKNGYGRLVHYAENTRHLFVAYDSIDSNYCCTTQRRLLL